MSFLGESFKIFGGENCGSNIGGIREPTDRQEFNELQYRIEDLLHVQDNRLADNMNNLSIGNPSPSHRDKHASKSLMYLRRG